MKLFRKFQRRLSKHFILKIFIRNKDFEVTNKFYITSIDQVSLVFMPMFVFASRNMTSEDMWEREEPSFTIVEASSLDLPEPAGYEMMAIMIFVYLAVTLVLLITLCSWAKIK